MAKLCKAGQQLREQIDDDYPDRDRKSDGWIADARHLAKGSSDHIPDDRAGGVVRALDIVDMFPSKEDILLKMDIEGAEYSLFYNTPKSVFKRFKHIYIELHEEKIAGSGNIISKIDNYIKDLGFNGVWEGRFFTNKETGKEDNSEIGVFKYTRL